MKDLRVYGVSRADKQPLIQFMVDALVGNGCTILHAPQPDEAPFRITFETSTGERMGIIAYAFYANDTKIKNRPEDEHRFQIKYGGDLSGLHHVFIDPYELYVTLFVGINPDRGFFVAADPNLHNPTRFSVSIEFKEDEVRRVERSGWHAWERERRGGAPHASKKRTALPSGAEGDPLFEVLVGGTQENFLRLIRFEREAFLESPGERQLIADRMRRGDDLARAEGLIAPLPVVPAQRLHALAEEFQLSPDEVLELIAERRRLKIAVRGAVAEQHLVSALKSVPGVESCRRIVEENKPDVELVYRGAPVIIECKNSSRQTTADGLMKIDLQKTRTSKSDPCSRYYSPQDFDVVAACVHACTERWEFRYALSAALDKRKGDCQMKLDNNVKLDSKRWTDDARTALELFLSST